MSDETPLPPPFPDVPDQPVVDATPRRPRASPLPALARKAFRSWFSIKGIVMILVAALLPAFLAGAWIATHQRDAAVVALDWYPQGFTVGQRATFNATIENPKALAVGDVNVTFRIHALEYDFVNQRAVLGSQVHNHTARIVGLGGHERRTVNTSWSPVEANIYYLIVEADPPWEDRVNEIEEFNNVKSVFLEVQVGAPEEGTGPTPPPGLAGSPSPATTVDLAVGDITFEPAALTSRDNATLSVTVRNAGTTDAPGARVTIRLGTVTSGFLSPKNTTTQTVDLNAGASTVVTLDARQIPPDGYWAEAFVTPGPNTGDADTSNNYQNQSFAVAGDFRRNDPVLPERATIKAFYLEVLEDLMIPIVLPFLALYFAAGTISDERNRGTLTYLLTRPFGRGSLPIIKFFVSFLVAAAAVTVGVVATYLVLLGTPQRDVGFLTTPLLESLLTLFVYGSAFTFLGVVVNRFAYLWGILWVLMWEYAMPFVIALGVIQNTDLRWFTLLQHLRRALGGWSIDKGVAWLPEGAGPLESLRILGIASVVFLGLAYYTMRTREFDTA